MAADSRSGEPSSSLPPSPSAERRGSHRGTVGKLDATSAGADERSDWPPRASPAPSERSAVREATGIGINSSQAGAAEPASPGRRRNVPADGSPVREATGLEILSSQAGAAEPASPGRRRSAPPGGSAVREATSVGAPFQWPIRVYWEDTDAGGIVFYANYLKFFERSRTEWLRFLGIEQQRLRLETGGMFIVAETTLRYLRPARLDDELFVTAKIVETGRASLIIDQQALLKSELLTPAQHGQNTNLLCEGRVKIGWVNAETLRPMRLPAQLRERLKSA